MSAHAHPGNQRIEARHRAQRVPGGLTCEPYEPAVAGFVANFQATNCFIQFADRGMDRRVRVRGHEFPGAPLDQCFAQLQCFIQLTVLDKRGRETSQGPVMRTRRDTACLKSSSANAFCP